MSRSARVGLALALLALPGMVAAKYRVHRVLDWRDGLRVSYTVSVEQDPEGFLWVTGAGGTFRYDGSEMVLQLPVGKGLVPGSATAGKRLTYVSGEDGWNVQEPDGTPVQDPDRRPLRTYHAYMTRDGSLWALGLDSVRRRAPDGTWSPRLAYPDGARLLAGGAPGRDDSLLVPCREALFRVDRSGTLTLVARLRGAIGAIDRADGSTAIGTFVGGRSFVYEVRDGEVREIHRYPTRFIALAERQGALWIAYDNRLVRLAADEPLDEITQADGLLGGGGLLVDREGSLWIAGGGGLVQFPEPDTVSWVREAPVLGRHLLLDRGTVWMSTWGGLYRARLAEEGWTVALEPRTHIAAPCLDREGTLWTVVPDAFSSIPRDRPPRFFPEAGLHYDAEECAVAQDGGLWFPTSVGLYFLSPGAERPRRVLAPEPGAEPFRDVYEDPGGTLWVTREREVCHTAARELERSGRADWACTPAPRETLDLLRMDSGSLWATTFDAGVWRLRGDTWEEIPGSRDLLSRWTSSLARSPRGGVWLTGEGNLLRVRERPDLAPGWEVLERPGFWQGLPTPGVFDVAEAEDGTLWAASNKSLIRMPPHARAARPEPPPVVLVEAAVDGHPLDLGRRRIELPYRTNRLELRFAALSYRDPSLIRYRSRLHPDDAWSAPTKQPFFRFVDLSPGRYRVEVEGSLDGERWSPAKPEVTFEVLRPWYGTWWFRALAAALLAGALFLAYRLRLASILKLERQRMRIAMDLHDEVGSGLGSIGVLASLLSRQDLPEPQRSDLSGRITGVARELSQSLGDIVWSLRTGSGDLEALWGKILDRARPLFAGGKASLHVVAPDPVPAAPLSLMVRRNVSLIAIEALHNAARHAAASSVTLALHPDGDGWSVVVEDDGQGLTKATGTATRKGLGLEAMRLRAAEMGGSVVWQAPEGGGTRVVVRFRAGRD